MGSKEVLHLVVTASLGVALVLAIAANRDDRGATQREIDALRKEIARVAESLDALAAREDAGAAPLAADPAETGEREGLRAQVRSLELRVQALTRVSRDAVAAPSPSSSGPLETARSQAQLTEHLEDVLLREPESGEARRFAAELGPRIRTALPSGASLREIRCRPSLCRVEMSYPDLDSYEQFLETHLRGDPNGIWQGPAFLLPTDPGVDRGDVIALAYLGRDEHVFDPQPAR